MADSKVIYEYTDGSGRTRRVSKLADVPRRHIQSMVILNESEPAHAAKVPAREGLSLPFDFPLRLDFPTQPNTPLILGAIVAVVWLKTKNYILKLLLAVVAGMWLFFQGYDKLMNSNLLKPYERPPAPSSPAEGPG